MIDEEELLSRLNARGAFRGRSEAMRAARATVLALGERLRDDERTRLARELPPSIALVLERAAYAGDFDRDALVARVAAHENVEPGFALEHAEVVCAALGHVLSDEGLAHLRRDVGEAIAPLFTERQIPEPEVPVSARPRGTLATGREGARRPLSEAKPDKE